MTERRPNPNRKDENIRRANRVIQTRSFVLMLVMGVGMFVLLFFQLFDLQIVRHEELQSKAVNQQTRRTVVTASRGTIYALSLFQSFCQGRGWSGCHKKRLGRQDHTFLRSFGSWKIDTYQCYFTGNQSKNR